MNQDFFKTVAFRYLWNRRADALDVGENLAAEAAAKKESRESERKREREIKWTDGQMPKQHHATTYFQFIVELR